MTGRHCSLPIPVLLLFALSLSAEPLPGTQPLTVEGDIPARMVAGIHRYLDRELAVSVGKRQAYWKADFSSPDAYAKSVEPNRERLRRILGVVDPRLPATEPQYVNSPSQPALIAETGAYRVFAVRWPVLDGLDCEGLLVEPQGKPAGQVIVLPDADQTPEELTLAGPGEARKYQPARRLAEAGCRVVVPILIDRQALWSGNPRAAMTNQPHREFVYRIAYHMGRHVIGYEVQKVLAVVDWFTRSNGSVPVGVVGHGEGGLVALASAALDPRIGAAAVSGYFGPREGVAEEPVYRNIWGLLREFGDAELARLVAPRKLVILETGRWPEVTGPPAPKPGQRTAAAPGSLRRPESQAVDREVNRAQQFFAGKSGFEQFVQIRPMRGLGAEETLDTFLAALVPARSPGKPVDERPTDRRKDPDRAGRQKRQLDQMVNLVQRLKTDADQRRQEFFWSKHMLSSLENYQKSVEPLRQHFEEEIIGKLPPPSLPANPRSRLAYDQPKWKGYEVMLDVYPDVFAYGVLLLPKDLKRGEKRPVVVCQHGLEGQPSDVVDPKVKSVYHAFGAQLADRGYIVYAPQNPYRGGNTFRQINRKANPLKLTMFAFIVRQHEWTLDWLASLPNVDPERIAFYGLSYGGETAMRVPPLVKRYALSICSADFNQFTWKTVGIDHGFCYPLVNTYEIFDFNMGNTFSHAEMAALIAPRPFMVERGHDDGVSIDEWVAYEYAKVRRLYAKLGIPERTAIEFFNGGHEINSKGTFAFLREHLKWPK